MPEAALKKACTRVAFGDVVQLIRERSSDPVGDGFERYVGLEHIDPGDLKIRRWGDIADGITFTSVFRSGQVLFGKRRAYQRKVAVADFDGVCSGDIYVLAPKNTHLLSELLPFICQTDRFFEHAVGTSAGSLSPRTNWESLASYEFALPPLEEQHRMARALWALEKLRRGLFALRAHKKDLWISVFRTMAGLDRPENEAAVIRGESSETGRGWDIRPIRDVCTQDRQGVQVGPFGGSVSSRHFVKKGVPVLKINNISEDGVLDLEDLVQLNGQQAKMLSDRYSVRIGDVVTAAQATIGRTAIVDHRIEGAIISQHIIRVSPDPEVCLSSWLHACFYSPLVLRQLHRAIQGGTRAGLNTDDVGNLLVPIPPVADQKDFVRQLDAVRNLNQVSMERTREVVRLSSRLMSALGGGDV